DGLAEAPRQCQEPLWRQRLVAEENHQMVEQRLPDGGDRCIGQVIGEIDPAEFRADGTGDGRYLDRIIAHGAPSLGGSNPVYIRRDDGTDMAADCRGPLGGAARTATAGTGFAGRQDGGRELSRCNWGNLSPLRP